jgi:hypothetical protein
LDRLDDVEAKLADTEKEADKARKDSKNARDQFNDVKRKRYVNSFALNIILIQQPDASYSIRRTTIFQIVSTKSIKTSPKGRRHRWEALHILV